MKNMSRLKALIYAILLMIALFALLVASAYVNITHDVSLCYIILGTITGLWISDTAIAFYKWLIKDV